MDDPEGVDGIERRQELERNVDAFARRKGAGAAKTSCERLAVEAFHHQVRTIAREVTRCDDATDVRMLNRRARASFAREPGIRAPVTGIGLDHLYGDGAIELEVV